MGTLIKNRKVAKNKKNPWIANIKPIHIRFVI